MALYCICFSYVITLVLVVIGGIPCPEQMMDLSGSLASASPYVVTLVLVAISGIPCPEQKTDLSSSLLHLIRGTALVYRDLQRQNKPLDELASPPSK